MTTDNRRAEGRRPPHRGRSERESNQALGAMRDEETILTAQGLSNREEAPNWQRRTEQARLRSSNRQN